MITIKSFLAVILLPLIISNREPDPINGAQLYKTVQKYVSLGEHRTGTPADSATSAWLGQELRSYGYQVKYLKFGIRQFFPENVSLSSGGQTIHAAPLWWVNEHALHTVTGKLISLRPEDKPRGNIALIHLPLPGKNPENTAIYLDSLSDAGVSGIVAITDNLSNEIQQYNTSRDAKPWKVPIILIAPKDTAVVHQFITAGANVTLTIDGKFKDVTASNVYGTVGSGKEYIVVSTPISGWFTCGGERGSGLAIWLALAKWAAKEKSTYTFVFTGNSGHEHAFMGAHKYLESDAPPPEKTHLWLHFGAGAATLKYTGRPGHLVKEAVVDDKRRFFYSEAVGDSFTKAFGEVPGQKILESKNPGGELVYVAAKGYKRFVGVTYAHPFFHVRTDDASTTSPEILESTANAFRNFIATEIAGKN